MRSSPSWRSWTSTLRLGERPWRLHEVVFPCSRVRLRASGPRRNMGCSTQRRRLSRSMPGGGECRQRTSECRPAALQGSSSSTSMCTGPPTAIVLRRLPAEPVSSMAGRCRLSHRPAACTSTSLLPAKTSARGRQPEWVWTSVVTVDTSSCRRRSAPSKDSVLSTLFHLSPPFRGVISIPRVFGSSSIHGPSRPGAPSDLTHWMIMTSRGSRHG